MRVSNQDTGNTGERVTSTRHKMLLNAQGKQIQKEIVFVANYF